LRVADETFTRITIAVIRIVFATEAAFFGVGFTGINDDGAVRVAFRTFGLIGFFGFVRLIRTRGGGVGLSGRGARVG